VVSDAFLAIHPATLNATIAINTDAHNAAAIGLRWPDETVYVVA
jgi:hypothetical protein